MVDNAKAHSQRATQHTAAGRRATGSPRPDQAIIRHLAVELYNERRRAEADAKSADGEEPTEDAISSEAGPDRTAGRMTTRTNTG